MTPFQQLLTLHKQADELARKLGEAEAQLRLRGAAPYVDAADNLASALLALQDANESIADARANIKGARK